MLVVLPRRRDGHKYILKLLLLLLLQIVYPLVHELPFVYVSPGGLDHQLSAQMGNLLNPAYVPSLFRDFPRPMTLYHRFQNLVWHLIRPFGRQFYVLPQIQEIVRQTILRHCEKHIHTDYNH